MRRRRRFWQSSPIDASDKVTNSRKLAMFMNNPADMKPGWLVIDELNHEVVEVRYAVQYSTP